MKSAYLGGQMPTAVNARPEGTVVETIECGVEISGDENHQWILRKYGYDAWVWVYVVEDLIRKGKYAGYPTYWVFLDGEEIGHITKYQMERHCSQVPPEGAVMLAHVRNRKADKERHVWQLRLQMPEEHDPVELPHQDMPKPPHAKTPREPEPIKVRSQGRPSSARRITFSNPKPHKKVLAPIGQDGSHCPSRRAQLNPRPVRGPIAHLGDRKNLIRRTGGSPERHRPGNGRTAGRHHSIWR